MGDIVLPIKPGMRQMGSPNWITISFDEKTAAIDVPRGPLREMMEAAVRKMWEIADPGVKKYLAARKTDRSFHSKNLSPPEGAVPVQEAFMWSACGTIASMTGLILANSGVEGLNVLRCQAVRAGREPEGHRVLMFPAGAFDECPHGALMQVNRNDQPILCPLRSGDIEKFCQANERPVFRLADDATLTEIDALEL